MAKRTKLTFAGALIALVLGGASLAQDKDAVEIKLKTGEEVSGKLVGFTGRIYEVEVDGKVRKITEAEVDEVRFVRDAAKAPADGLSGKLPAGALAEVAPGDWASFGYELTLPRGEDPARSTFTLTARDPARGLSVFGVAEEAGGGEDDFELIASRTPVLTFDRRSGTVRGLAQLVYDLLPAPPPWRRTFKAKDVSVTEEKKTVGTKTFACRKVAFELECPGLEVSGWKVAAWISSEVKGPGLVALEAEGQLAPRAKKRGPEEGEKKATLKAVVTLVGFGAGNATAWGKAGPTPREEAPGLAKDAHGNPLPRGARLRLGSRRFRHRSPVFSVAFSPDGKVLASKSNSGDVRFWEPRTGASIPRPHYGGNWVQTIAFSPDGAVFVVDLGRGGIGLADTATGKITTALEGHQGKVLSVVFAPDGRAVYTTGEDRTVRVWNAIDGAEVPKLHGRERNLFGGHDKPVTGLALSPDGKVLATAGRTCAVWDAASGAFGRAFEVEGEVAAVAFSKDGKRLYAAVEKTTSVFDVTTGEVVAKLEGHAGRVQAIAVSPDGKSVATTGQDGSVRLWDTTTFAGTRTVSLGRPDSWVSSVAFSPDGKLLAAGSWDTTVRIFDVATGALVLGPEGHTQQIVHASASGPIVTGSRDGSVRSWDPTTGRALATIERADRDGDAFASGPGWAAFVDKGKVVVHDVATGKERPKLATGKGVGAFDRLVAVDAKTLAVLSRKKVELFDVVTGEKKGTLDLAALKTDFITAFAATSDGKTFALAAENQLVLVDASGKILHALDAHDESSRAIAFSPDGSRVVSAGLDGRVLVFETATGKKVFEANVAEGSSRQHTAVAFSPDGKRIATGDNHAIVELRDAATGAVVSRLPSQGPLGHDMGVNVVVFAPDGKTLVTAGGEGTALVWDLGGTK